MKDFYTNNPVEQEIETLKRDKLSAILNNEMRKFRYEYEKKMFEEKRKNIDEFIELIKQYQQKLEYSPEIIAHHEADIKEREKIYKRIEKNYKKEHRIGYGDPEDEKLNTYRWELNKYKHARYDYLNSTKPNFADQLDHRYNVQESLIIKQMHKEIRRRLEEGQRLEEEMLAPRIEQAIRRYRATHGY